MSCYMLGIVLAGGTPHSIYMVVTVVCCTGVLTLSPFTLLDSFILSNCLVLVKVSNTATWALCISTLLAHANTPPLVMQSSFLLLSVPLLFPPTYTYHLGHV